MLANIVVLDILLAILALYLLWRLVNSRAACTSSSTSWSQEETSRGQSIRLAYIEIDPEKLREWQQQYGKLTLRFS